MSLATYRWQRFVAIALTFALIFIAGCASPPRAQGSFNLDSNQWHGRLALRVASVPPRAFSSDFDLQGSAADGSLTFSTSLGSTLARMQWGPGFATLYTTGEPTQFESLSDLVRQATGTDIPIESLFRWLQGENTDTPGWSADFADFAQGRFTARHAAPQGNTELKIILDR
jgi:outer membrane lipoprotein LolB